MRAYPAGLTVEGLTPGVTPGIRFVYPNYAGAAPGRVAEFLNYDPLEKGWYAYGSGRVSEDGLQVVPDAGTEIYKATGFGISFGPEMPPVTPQTCGERDADPVDLRTGLFMHHARGAAVSDRLPVAAHTRYRPGDSGVRDFGKGVFHSYSHYLYKPGAGHYDWDVFWVVLPDCSKIPFRRTSPLHASYPHSDYTAVNDQVPGAWFGAVMGYRANVPGLAEYRVMEVTRRDGQRLMFSLSGGHLLHLSDRLGHKIELIRLGGALLRITGPSGRHLDLTATAANPRISQVTDMGGRSWHYAYDAQQRLTRITYPDASFERYVYDAHGRMQEVWDRRGNRMVLNQYDASGRVIQQTLSDGGIYQLGYTTAADGTITQTTVTDPTGSSRRVRFHASGWPMEDTQALGSALERTTTQERDALGFMQATVDPLGRRTEFTYDSQQRLIRTTVLAGTPQALTARVAYNAQHDPISSTDAEGRVTTFVWDSRRRLENVIDDRQRAVHYRYDSQDRVISITDPEQRMTTFSYQLHDLVRSTDAQGRSVKRYVDALGRTTSISDEHGKTARLEYDALDRIITQRSPDGSSTGFSYDPMGNLKSLTDAKLSVTRWDYDSKQRPIQRTDALNQIERWSYNDSARTVTHTDRRLRTTTYSYDLLSRLTGVDYGGGDSSALTYDIGDRLHSITDAAGTIAYQYNALDSVTRETTPSGFIDYGYDAFGRITAMTPNGHPVTQYGYDPHARVQSITRASESVTFGYDTQDRLTGITLPNGTQRTQRFDANDRLSGIEYRRNGALTGDLNYTFDDAGQLIQRSGSLAEDLLPEASGATAFDVQHRQIGQGDHTYAYDDNGNLITDTVSGTVKTYRYDRRDRLIGIDVNGVEAQSFQYDVFGRRIAKTDGSVTTRYRYDGDNVVEETTNGIVTTTLNGFGLDERYSRTGPSGTSTYLTDALGSTLGLQANNGNWQARYRYTPYGETQAQAFDANGISLPSGASADAALAALNNPFQYTGRENDGEGLYYYRARYYQPKQGRFTQEDPLGFVDGPNPYAYVGGDPVSRTDPTGLFADSVTMGCMQMPELCVELFATIAEGQSLVQARLGNTCGSEYFAALAGLTHSAMPLVVAGSIVAIFLPGGAAKAAKAGREIKLIDGFYQAEGSAFKFSKYYYEKLWATGRGAPFLQAGEVLSTAKLITPDRMPGFNRYINDFFEMIYNPLTNEVWHLQPLRN